MGGFSAIIDVIGRVFLALIFLASAVGSKIPNFTMVAQAMEAKGVPFPAVSLAGAIVFLLAGALSVISGYRPRFGALLLSIFLVLATYFFHDFWSYEAGTPDRQMQQIHFLKNVGLLGAMLILVARGTGPLSLSKQS